MVILTILDKQEMSTTRYNSLVALNLKLCYTPPSESIAATNLTETTPVDQYTLPTYNPRRIHYLEPVAAWNQTSPQ